MGRFKKLVESEEGMEKFIADYRIASWVLFPYGRQGLFACPRHAPGVSAYEVHCH